MAIKLTSTADAARDNGVKCLVHARAKHGKTCLIATAPNPVIISAESGLLSLAPDNMTRLERFVGRKLPRNIPVIEIETLNDLNEAFEWCKSSTECKDIQTLGLDSITEVANRVLEFEKAVMINGKLRDPRQAYGELVDKISKLLRAFRDIPGKNVCFAAQQEFIKDDVTGVTKFMAAMPGAKLGQQLPFWVDEVFALEIGKVPATADAPAYEYRYLRTQPDFNVDAGDRSGALAPIEKPDLSYIFAKIRGENFVGEPIAQ